MKVTLNVILENLKHYRLESRVDESLEISFRQARLLEVSEEESGEKSEEGFDPEFLYIGFLSEALAAAKKARGVIFLCIHDTDMSEHEREHFQPSFVVIREDIAPMKLFFEVQKNILAMQEWHDAMQEAVINQKSIQEILGLSEPVIGNFITINDSAFSLLAYTKGIPTDDEVSIHIVEKGYHSAETVRKFKRVKRFDRWFNSGEEFVISTDRHFSHYVTVTRVFIHDETTFSQVVMHCNFRELSPGLIDMFKELTSFLGYHIERDLANRRNSIYSSIIADLMTGRISDPDIAVERAKSVGIAPSSEMAVLLLAENLGENVIFSDRIAHDISQQFQYIQPVNYNQRLLLLLNHPNILYYMNKQGIGERLNKFLEENNIYCGVSDTVNNLLDLPDAYLQAEFALDNRAHISHFEKGQPSGQRSANVILFSDHYAEFLLNHDKRADRIWRSSKYGKMLERLRKNDLEKNTNNLAVLYSFLINERRATETAAATYMHRNNVLYRIGRIEEMLDIRLDDPATRLNLLITFLLFDQAAFDAAMPVMPSGADYPDAEAAGDTA